MNDTTIFVGLDVHKKTIAVATVEGYCQTEGCGHFYVFNVDNLISGMGATMWCLKFFRVSSARSAAET